MSKDLAQELWNNKEIMGLNAQLGLRMDQLVQLCTLLTPLAATTQAAADVLAERTRQIAVEGFAPEGDYYYQSGELECAAACYAGNAGGYVWAQGWPGESVWPWDRKWWKPSTPRRDLVKAGALILAAIEKRDSLSNNSGGN